MINFNVGNTWDPELLHGIEALHADPAAVGRVTELYGSVRDPVGSARPLYRLPRRAITDVSRFVQDAHRIGVAINYTANVFCLGDVESLVSDLPQIKAYFRQLQDIGVDIVTAAHPIIMEVVSQETSLPLSVSTICHVNSLSGITAYARAFRVSKVCMSIYRNRDIAFLRHAQAVAGAAGIVLELIANEFCSTYGAPCIYRDSCYSIHGHGGNQGRLLKDYPMGRCRESRSDISSWLKAMFVLPEDIEVYQARTGIDHFKLTGRTHPTREMLRILAYYLRRQSPENLLDLWIPLEHIGQEEGTPVQQPMHISTSALVSGGFSAKWLNSPQGCSEICGGTACCHCDDVARKVGSRGG